MAWKMACLYLKPLLPVEHQEVLSARPRVTWDTISMAYVELRGRSKGCDIRLMAVATAVRILYSHTRDPPREEEAPELLEVMYFFQMCDHAKLSLKKQYGRPDGRGSELFRLCKFCWRTTVSGRQICFQHASMVVDGTADATAAFSDEAKARASRRKLANRQKQDFDVAISKLLTQEVMEFHQTEFTADVLLPQSGRMKWLSKRRPWVAKLLKDTGAEVRDDNFAAHVLALLHDSAPMPEVWQSTYEMVNTTINQAPELIWPILARAESWLVVRNFSRKNWGGKRENSGRRKDSRGR